MHFSTGDTCCTLYCWQMVKPLFYRLHEVETVDLQVWIAFMTCLDWWAGTTGPPRIPPSQGCEHLSVMSFIQKIKNKKWATQKTSQNDFKKWQKVYRSSPCVWVRNFIYLKITNKWFKHIWTKPGIWKWTNKDSHLVSLNTACSKLNTAWIHWKIALNLYIFLITDMNSLA